MRTIFRTRFGSHLYGTDTELSDVDIKSVFIPSAQKILLGAANYSVNNNREKAEGEKNFAGEVDEEKLSLMKFLKLLSEGQVMAIDCVFAPRSMMLQEPSWVWEEIQQNKDRLLTKKTAAFLGYARKQAAKYGIKGSRVAASRSALKILQTALYSGIGQDPLYVLQEKIAKCADAEDHMQISHITEKNGTTNTFWEVCGRKLPFNASISNAWDIVNRLVDEYGRRALQAETNNGIDWKALSHAVRVGHQAFELLSTGNVTFPLPNAPHILKIKQGEMDYKNVAAEIENLLEMVETAAETSTLRDVADHDWIDGFVAERHREEIFLEKA